MTTPPAVAHPESAAPKTPAAAPVVIGITSLKLSGWIQVWYANGSHAANTFRIRRAEIKFAGTASSRASWVVGFDAAKSLSVNQTFATVAGQTVVRDGSINQASRMLQDAYLTVGLFRHLSLDAGQFKLPFSHEGLMAPWKLDAVE